MSVPPVVVFDLGKVLLDFDFGIAAAKISRRGKLTPEQTLEVLIHTPPIYLLESGQMTNEQFAGAICSTCGFSGQRDEFYEAFGDIFTEVTPMTAMQAALRANGIQTCILSNTNEIAVRHIRRRFAFFAAFDHYVLSFEKRAMKPDPRIYAFVEQATGQRGDAIVYLDDRAENVQGGLARGWRALLHASPERTIQSLRAMGLPVS